MPNISISLPQDVYDDLEFLIELKNQFLLENDIPLEVTKTGIVRDLIIKEAQRVRDINQEEKK